MDREVKSLAFGGSVMSEPFSITKLVSGWATGDYWGKLISFGLGFLVVGFISYAVYKAYIKKPEPTTDMDAEEIINHYNQPKSTFGCATSRTYITYPTNRTKL